MHFIASYTYFHVYYLHTHNIVYSDYSPFVHLYIYSNTKCIDAYQEVYTPRM